MAGLPLQIQINDKEIPLWKNLKQPNHTISARRQKKKWRKTEKSRGIPQLKFSFASRLKIAFRFTKNSSVPPFLRNSQQCELRDAKTVSIFLAAFCRPCKAGPLLTSALRCQRPNRRSLNYQQPELKFNCNKRMIRRTDEISRNRMTQLLTQCLFPLSTSNGAGFVSPLKELYDFRGFQVSVFVVVNLFSATVSLDVISILITTSIIIVVPRMITVSLVFIVFLIKIDGNKATQSFSPPPKHHQFISIATSESCLERQSYVRALPLPVGEPVGVERNRRGVMYSPSSAGDKRTQRSGNLHVQK